MVEMELLISTGILINLKTLAIRTILLYFFVCLAVVIDFISGVNKSKRDGLPRTSHKYRRTIVKLNQYLLLMFLFTIVDFSLLTAGILETLDFVTLPYFSFVALIVIWIIEVKSVWENTEKGHQDEIKKATKAIIALAKNRKDIDNVVKMLEEQIDKEQSNKK